MKTKAYQIPAVFAMEEPPQEIPVLVTAPRGPQEARLEALKAELLRAVAGDSTVRGWMERVANEAAALAWFTPFPSLFLPVLMEEKIAALFRHLERQRQIWNRSRLAAAECLS